MHVTILPCALHKLPAQWAQGLARCVPDEVAFQVKADNLALADMTPLFEAGVARCIRVLVSPAKGGAQCQFSFQVLAFTTAGEPRWAHGTSVYFDFSHASYAQALEELRPAGLYEYSQFSAYQAASPVG